MVKKTFFLIGILAASPALCMKSNQLLYGNSSESQISNTIFTKEQVQKTLEELTPEFEKIEKTFKENPLGMIDPDSAFKALKAMVSNEKNFSCPEFICQIDLFLDKMPVYKDAFMNGQNGFKDVLALIDKDRDEFFKLCTHSAPVIEKIMQLYMRGFILPIVVPIIIQSNFPDITQEHQAVINYFLERSVVQNAPFCRIFGFLGFLNHIPIKAIANVISNLDQYPDLCKLLGLENPSLMIPDEYKEYLQRATLLKDFVQSVTISTAVTEGTALGGSITAPVLSQPVTFPLTDDFFKNKTFRELAQDAQRGTIDTIKRFVGDMRYAHDKDHNDEKKQNLLSHAILGYCSGKDEAWSVFVYLAEQKLSLSDAIRDYLTSYPKDDSADKIARKRQIFFVLEESKNFVADEEILFYEFPTIPPVLDEQNGKLVLKEKGNPEDDASNSVCIVQ